MIQMSSVHSLTSICEEEHDVARPNGGSCSGPDRIRTDHHRLGTIFGVLTHLGLMRVLPGGEAWMILLSLTAASLMFLISGEVMSRSALARRRHRLMVREDEGAA